MKLTHVHLRYAPGLSKGLPRVDVGDGLTFIVGPNASGKSTLARTMRLVFWSVANPPSIDASVRVTNASGHVLSTEIQSGHASTSLRQTAMEESTGKLYKLGLAELLQDGHQSDQEFAARLQTELHGGVPVAQIREDIRSGQTHYRAPSNALKSAKSQVRDAERQNLSLLSNEKKAQHLQREREKAEDARSTVEAIDMLIRALDVNAERNELRGELATYPQALERLRSDDVDVKRGLETRLQNARRTHDEQHRTLSILTAACDRIEPEWKTLTVESVDVGESIRSALVKATDDVRDAEAMKERQNDRIQSAENKVFGGPVERPIDAATKEELKSTIDALRDSEASLQAFSEMRGFFDAVDDGAERNEARVQQQVDALRLWLRTPKTPSGIQGGWRVLVAAISALAVAAVIYVAMYNGPREAQGWAILALSALAAAFSIWQWIHMRQATAHHAMERERAQNAARQAGVGLSTWSDETVSGTLHQAEYVLVQCREVERVRQRRNEIGANQREAASRYAHAQTALEEIAVRTGVLPHILTLEAAEVFHRTEAWLAAEAAYDEAVSIVKHVEEKRAHYAQKWGQWLQKHGLETHAERVGEDAVISLARRQLAELRALVAKIEHADATMTREDQLVDDAVDDMQALRDRLGEWFASEAKLEHAIAQSVRRQEIKQQLASTEPRHVRVMSELQEVVGYLVAAGLLDKNAAPEDGEIHTDALQQVRRADIERTRRDFEADAERLNDLIEEVARLRERLEHARRGSILEDAYAARAQAEENSGAQAERRGMLKLEEMMLRWSVKQADGAGASESLDDADRWLRRFTYGRFGLRLSMEGDLVGHDVEAGEDRALSELSDATRVQALLAARLVAIRDAEAEGEPLPIVLDEVFSTTDPERFEAIAGALSELVRDGRQIIYLTADPGEYARWVNLRERAHLVEPHVQWLGDLESDARSEDAVHGVAIPEHRPVPAPEGRSAEEYAKLLALTPPRMEQRVEEWPLLWLLPNSLDAVHAAMTQRLVSSGQVLSLTASLGDTQVWGESTNVSADLSARLRRRAQMLRAMQERWARGVSRPFRWADVETSEMVTDAFQDRVLRLFKEQANDPETFIESVGNLPRFQSARRDGLREHFEVQGILAQAAPATVEELREQALRTVDSALIDAQDIAWLEGLLTEVRSSPSTTHAGER